MSFAQSKVRSYLYLLPYFILLVIGTWYRYSTSGLAFLDGDSEHYLMPPILKALIGEWHKGERPMQYLLFIYATLSYTSGIAYTIIAQQAIGILSAALLAAAWVVFISAYDRYRLLWHLAGYLTLAIYISSPVIMNYEQFIGPESVCMCIMSAIIYTMAMGLSGRLSIRMQTVMLSIAIFLNLYLVNPMPKWVFVSVYLEAVLIYRLIWHYTLPRSTKGWLIALPHLAFVLLVVIPENHYKIDNPNEDRVYIEYQQMAYTHFDLLARDKANFGMTPALQDSIMLCYEKSKEHPYRLIGFCSDDLMWGRANSLIDKYHDHNFDSIGRYFKHLNFVLATRYPIPLYRSIARQVYAFYISPPYIKKDLYGFYNLVGQYPSNVNMLHEFDKHIPHHLDTYKNLSPKADPDAYRLSPRYPAVIAAGSKYDLEGMPLIFSRYFIFYKHFQSLFVLAIFSFFALRLYQGRLFRVHLISVLYLAMFIYVVTIGIVHTFDIERFTTTIYPLILVTPLLALVYVGDFVLSRMHFADGTLVIHFKDPQHK